MKLLAYKTDGSEIYGSARANIGDIPSIGVIEDSDFIEGQSHEVVDGNYYLLVMIGTRQLRNSIIPMVLHEFDDITYSTLAQNIRGAKNQVDEDNRTRFALIADGAPSIPFSAVDDRALDEPPWIPYIKPELLV